MNSNLGTDHTYQQVVKVVRRKLGFYKHLSAYILINSVLILINLLNSPQIWWVQWVLLGWGIGIFFHGFQVLGNANNLQLEQHMIAKELEKQKK